MEISISGITNEWYDQTNVSVKYEGWWDGTLTLIPITNNNTVSMLYDWQEIKGGSISIKTKDKTAATLTATIPLSTFRAKDFTLQIGDVSVKSSELGVAAPEPSSSSSSSGDSGDSGGEGSGGSDNPAYNGIVIDGSFGDWDAVKKYDARCNNPQHTDCIKKAAAVWDGDSIYLYISEADGGSAATAGSNRAGVYALKTDLGNQLLLQLNQDGSVSGVEGASARHADSQWEISIPSSALPACNESFDFGIDTPSGSADDGIFVRDVTNLNSSGGGSGGGSGAQDREIIIDGLYGDWANYPHSRISYWDSGGAVLAEDTQGALFSKAGVLYAHVFTTLSAYTSSYSGAEFLAAVQIAFNSQNASQGEGGTNFYPKFFMVDDAGKVTVVDAGTRLSKGTHAMYIANIGSGYNFWNANFADIPDSEIFGRMMVTISEGRDEMEFEVDLQKVADLTGTDTDDYKLIETQFGLLGNQWIATAGTSTEPFLGIGLCIAVVACVLAGRQLRARRAAAAAAVAPNSPGKAGE